MFVLSTFLISRSASAAIYLNAYVTGFTTSGSNITIQGNIQNTTVSDTISGINVTGSVTGSSNSGVTGAPGTFNFNVSAPSAIGDYDMTVTTNSSALPTKTITVHIGNVSSGNITYINKKPPFVAGSTFNINVTLLNSTGDPLVNKSSTDLLKIFSANGQEVSGWTITALDSLSDSNGVIRYSIVIPSDADGPYIIVVEYGSVYSIFSVKSSYIVSVVTHDPSDENEIGFNFAPGSSVSILAKVRDINGNPTTATSVTAYIKAPDSSITTLSLTARDQNTYPGFYNNTFTASQNGNYEVRIDAVVGSSTIQSYTMFNTKSFAVRIESVKEFFMEWGGQAAFKAGDTVALNVIAINLTDDSIIQSPNSLNCSNITVTSMWNTSDNIQFTITNSTSSSQYMITPICKITFTAPSVSGLYGLRANVTIGSTTEITEGFFSVQNYLLKAATVSGMGGEMDFMPMATPGENATISIKAFNLTSNAAIDGTLIQNISVIKIIPLEFKFGATEITSNINYTVTYGSSPYVTLNIPQIIRGPVMVEIRANISGNIVRGSAFFVSSYVSGFLGPVQPETGGGPGPGGGGGPSFLSCTAGVYNFSGTVYETKTNRAANGVSIYSIAEVREEFTGRDVSEYVNLSVTGTTDSNGNVNISVTLLPGYNFEGFYFMILNVTYKGNYDGVPAGFMCRKFNFWPKVMSIGSNQDNWRIAPESGVVINVVNATRLSDKKLVNNQTTISLTRIMNFNPSKGGMSLLVNNTPLTFIFEQTGNITDPTSNNVSFVIYPQNFTLEGSVLSKWPNGFVELQPRVCDSTVGCDVSFGGFQIVPFDAWVEDWQWGGTYYAGQNISANISAKTNVSSIGNFTVKIGRPWEGELQTATIINATKLEDGWNNTNDTGRELWNLTFTIPSTIRKGGAELMITVNSSANTTPGEKTDLHLWLQISKYSVIIPYEEGLGWVDGYAVNNTEAQQQFGWNMTYINETYNTWSKTADGSVCAKDQFNVTRWMSGSSQDVVYNSSTKVLIVDNTTAGIYDTLIFNESGTIKIVDINNRNITPIDGSGSLYLWKIDFCGYVRLINTSTIALPTGGNWGGQYQTNKQFVVPYVIKKADNLQPGVTISVNGVAKQEWGGFGFEEKLEGEENSSLIVPIGKNYTFASVNTDTNGVAFLKVNISPSGRYNLFWKINISGDEDIASYESGTNVEIKKFMTRGGPAYWLSKGKVDLYWTNNTMGEPDAPVWGAHCPDPAGCGGSAFVPFVYNGTVTETDTFDFIQDSNITTPWYIIWAPNTNMTSIDDDTNMSQGNDTINDYDSLYRYINTSFDIQSTFGAEPNTRIAVSTYRNTSTGPTNKMTFLFYQPEPELSQIQEVTSATAIAHVKICAETFDKPQPLPIEGASIVLKAEKFLPMQPPTLELLQLYDPINGSAVSSVLTGPTGCAIVKAGPGALGTWPIGQTTWIQGTITNGTQTENVWGGGVWYSG